MESGIVGYSTITINTGWNMIAVNFENLADNEGISIQDLFPGTTEGLKGGNSATGDNIMVYNGGSDYTTYHLFETTSTVPALQAKNGKWVQGTTVATKKFKSGDAFWYRHRGTGVTITVAGAVSVAATQEIDIVNGFNMIGSAFPANFNPNSLDTDFWKNSGAVGGTSATGDNIMVYIDDNNYTTYHLFETTSTVPALQAKNWKWVQGTTVVDTNADVLPPTKGVWYRHRGEGFKLTIPTPIVD